MAAFNGKKWIFVMFLSILLLGYAMNSQLMKAPSASDSIQAPQSVTAEEVISCAENIVRTLARDDDRWDARITRRDVDAGILETGNFEEENESGFRVRIGFERKTGKIDIALKGAGAYFIDLGVKEAIVEFNSSMRECLVKPIK